MLQIESQAPCPTFHPAKFSLGGDQIGFCGIHGRLGNVDLHLIRFLVELDEQVAFANAVVVVDQHPHDLTGNARRDKRHVAIHVGVVGRDGVKCRVNPRQAEISGRGYGKPTDDP